MTLVWVGAFVILGLVGLRAHGAELTIVPVVVAAEASASISTASAASDVTFVETGEHAVYGSVQSWHLDLLEICMLGMLATLMLVVLFALRPWLHIRLGGLREWGIALPRSLERPQPLLLLHSISRT